MSAWTAHTVTTPDEGQVIDGPPLTRGQTLADADPLALAPDRAASAAIPIDLGHHAEVRDVLTEVLAAAAIAVP
jgi:hypothetical protein